MYETTPKDARYIPLVQQKYCCVPACISMVMLKHGLPLMPQEKLGYNLGLTVPATDKILFWKPRVGKRPSSGYGTQIYFKQYHPNTVFPKLGIPLRMTFHPISKFTNYRELEKFVTEKAKANKDILACFDNGKLSGDNILGGHVCVVDKVYIQKHTIRLIDPLPSQPKWKTVKINKLFQAMQFHGDNNFAGFWEFEKLKK